LLKKLTQIGDPIAIRVFKHEIAERIEESESIDSNIVQYLAAEHFLDCMGLNRKYKLFFPSFSIYFLKFSSSFYQIELHSAI